MSLSTDNSFDSHIFYLKPEVLSFNSIIHLNLLKDSWHTSLVSLVFVAVSFVLLELVVLFVDSIIGQMHEHVVHVGFVGWLVLLRCKPGQTFPKHKDTKRIDSID